MPDAYEIHEAQFLAQASATSAANALVIAVGPVPAGRIWTIFRAVGICSVAETQAYWYSVVTATGGEFPITTPQDFVMAPAVQRNFPALREGMEIKLFPSEQLYLRRAANTAGSTIALYAQYLESEVPYYVELDRQKVLQRRLRAMVETNPSRGRSGSMFGGGSTGALSEGGRERPRER